MRKTTVVSQPIELKIDRVKNYYSVAKLEKWVKNYLLKSLYIFREAFGCDELDRLISLQEHQLSSIQKAMLAKYKDECGSFIMPEYVYDQLTLQSHFKKLFNKAQVEQGM